MFIFVTLSKATLPGTQTFPSGSGAGPVQVRVSLIELEIHRPPDGLPQNDI